VAKSIRELDILELLIDGRDLDEAVEAEFIILGVMITGATEIK
jgi:hypothetical protein